MLVEIAKKNPKAVVDAWRRLHQEPEPTVDPLVKIREKCRKILKEGTPADAIKYWRSETGVSLKEAKAEIDKLR